MRVHLGIFGIAQLPALFPFISYAHLSYVPSAAVSPFDRQLLNSETERIIESLPEIRRLSLACFNRDFTKSTANALGYRLLGQDGIEDVIKILRFIVEQYPDSWNGFDSLGDAYMKNGDRSN